VLEPGARINLFTIPPQTAFWTDAIFWALLASSLMLAAGFLTRANSIAT
jgi:hypothetical protein